MINLIKSLAARLRQNKRRFTIVYFYAIVLLLNANNLYSQKKSTIDSLKTILKSNVFDSTRTSAQQKLFELYFQTDTVKANFYLTQLAQEIDNETYTISEENIFNVANLFYNYKNDYVNAIKYYNLALKTAKNNKKNIQIYYEAWLGYIYSNIGEHENARKHLINAIQTAENKKITKHLPFAYLVYAFELRNVGELDKAIANFKTSYQKSAANGDSTYIHVTLHEIGNIYSMQKKFKL